MPMRNKDTKVDWGSLFRDVSRRSSLLVVSIGAIVLIGWGFNISVFKSVFPGIVSMKANTALCFLLLGVGLWGLQESRETSFFWRTTSRSFALVVFFVGIATSCEYIFGWDLKIDQMLFTELPGAVMTYSPGRMAFNTSICFIFLGVSFLLSSFKESILRKIAQGLFFLPAYIAFLAFLSYLYGVETFAFGIVRYTAMAIHTAVAFLLISFGGIFNQPGIGIMRVVSDGSHAGILTRRFLVMTVFVSVLTDFLALLGVRFNWYDATFATALHAAVFLLAISAVVIMNGFLMMQSGEKEKQYEVAISESERRYKTLYDLSPDAIMILEADKGFTAGNPAAVKLFGCKDEAEFITRSPEDLSPEYQPDGELSSVKAQRMMAIAMDHGSHFFEWKHKRLEGAEFWATVLLSRTELEGRPMLQATVRDIDAQKAQEIALGNKIWELEKFYKATMDREKRIIELKGEIDALKAKLAGK